MSTYENISRRQYKRSFLKSIQSVYAFEPVDLNDSLRQEIHKLFQSNGYTIKETGDAPMLQCSRDSITIVVTGRGIVLSMEVKDYIKFDHYLELFSIVLELLNVLGCKTIKNIVFQKTNSYKIGKTNDSASISKKNIFQVLFSEKVRNCDDILSKTSENYIYAVQPTYSESEEFAIAQLLVSTFRVKPIEVSSLVEELKAINEEMYRLWYDATTDKLKALMDK